MAERSKFQFQMRDLLWAVSLTAAALGLLTPSLSAFSTKGGALLMKAYPELIYASYLLGIAFLGAGIGGFWRQAKRGFFVGAGIAFLSACCLPWHFIVRD